jgi:flagellar hook-associated protein 1 FlgK
MSIYGIGISGLAAAQSGLLTTGQNITNVNTPGFHRQQIIQSANLPQNSGAGFVGQGTHVDTVKRVYSEMLDGQVMQAQAQSSQLDAYSAQITQIDNMLADPSAGLSPALQDFFKGVQDVAANPASVPSRQSMLSSSQAMTSRFQAINQRLDEIRTGLNSAITTSVTDINAYAQQIANLNQQIRVAQAASNDQQPPNDMLDKREQMVAELNQVIKVTTLKQSDGSLNVFIGSGQPLVMGTTTLTLAATPSLEDPERLQVGVKNGGGTFVLPETSLEGGSLGAYMAFRRETLDTTQNSLGLMALGLAQTFNDQHHLGMDLKGSLGGDFFTVPLPKVIANTMNTAGATATAAIGNVGVLTTSDYRLNYSGGATPTWSLLDVTTNQAVTMTGLGTAASPFVADGLSIVVTPPTVATNSASFLIKPTINGARDIAVKLTDTAKIAAAAPISTSAPLANTGSGAISAGSVNAPPPPNANLQHDVTISFIDATHFSVTDNTTAAVLAASVVYNPTSGATLPYNGWTAQLTGAPATGDTFTVGPNTGGVADNRNVLQLAGLQTQNKLVGGTASYQGVYSQLVSRVGNKAREIDVTGKAQASLVSQTQQAQQSLSGVNLDEEAANLIRYQQAYQAAGKMLQVASTLFDTLLSIGR